MILQSSYSLVKTYSKMCGNMLCVAKGDVGRRVIAFLEQAGKRPADLVDASAGKITFQRIRNWRAGDNDPHKDLMPFLADETGRTIDELYGEDRPGRRTAARANTPRRTRLEKTGRIPRVGSISAGLRSNFEVDEGDFVDVPQEFVRDDFRALNVEGDSMTPFIEENDLLIFREHRSPKIGHVMSAKINIGTDNELWVAKLVAWDGERVVLRSYNKEQYEDIRENYQFGGFLVGWKRDDAGERTIKLNAEGLKPTNQWIRH